MDGAETALVLPAVAAGSKPPENWACAVETASSDTASARKERTSKNRMQSAQII
jgi:hypothetical protein